MLLSLPLRERELEGAAQTNISTAAPVDNLMLQLEETQAQQQSGRALQGQGSQFNVTERRAEQTVQSARGFGS